jgi:hypothetical protein
MYEHEHPGHLDEARRDTQEAIERELERMRRRTGEKNPEDATSDPNGASDSTTEGSEKEPPFDPGHPIS